MENRILASTGRTVPVNAGEFQSASQAVVGAMEKTQLDTASQLTAMSASQSDRLVTEAALAGRGLGLAAVVASVFLLVWFGRKVTRDLGGLNDSVRGMADERLPRVVERLRRGDDVDVAAESPPPATSSIQEISRIAESFGTVQAAAVEAAVDQARLRKGINQVFLNISMRNQSLLHRQLGMLDSMERRTSEPGALADLFRLDHLTTRMRRHAEGLIILSGSVPGRGWRDPVPVVDILRAAVAEVEDYVRVDVASETDDLVAGNAVSDVIHLIAELVENATVFSPPNTRIEVRAERVGTGLAAEVEDRGLGLSPDELDDINARLASPADFDPAHSEQLGLFVVTPAGGPARHQGLAPPVRVRRHHGRGAAAVRRGGAEGRGQPGGSWGRPTGRHPHPRPDRTAPDARDRVRARSERRGEHREAGMADGSLGDRAAGANGRDDPAAVFPGGPGVSRGPWVRAPVGDHGATLVPGSPARTAPARDVHAGDIPAGTVAAGTVAGGTVVAGTVTTGTVAGGAGRGRVPDRHTRGPRRCHVVRQPPRDAHPGAAGQPGPAAAGPRRGPAGAAGGGR